MDVPAATSVKDIYPSDAVETQSKRWDSLLSKFEKSYGKRAEYVSRSPGRVNLIGEHIDYSLYDVLPMALEVDVLLAFTIEDTPSIKISSVDSERYPTKTIQISPQGEVEIDASAHEWTNYFKAGLRGVLNFLKEKDPNHKFAGMSVLVDGNVPAGGGLSSSSAVVCASALAVLTANGETKIDKKWLVGLAIASERFVGVFGGGMDQSASVCSMTGSASYVSFVPSLEVTPVKFPDTNPELAFLVANTFVASDKHVTAPIYYNLRVVECTMAAAVLAKIFGLKAELPKDQSPLGTSLRGFHNLYFKEKEGIEDNTKTSIEAFQKQLETLCLLVSDYLPQEEGYTREEISSILDISVDELNKRFMSKFSVRADRFKLRQRTLHVFSEATRVIKFRRLLSSPPESSTGDEILTELGGLMNAAQDSGRDAYDCSCPELDLVCELARGAGSYGSRLTGAGWGGGSVHLVPKHKIESVKKAWIDGYYSKKFPEFDDEKLKEAIVVSEPGSGAYIYKMTGEKVK